MRVLAVQNAVGARRHGELLASMIEQVLAAGGLGRADLGAIAVGTGPGPHTGPRAGPGAAPGLPRPPPVPAPRPSPPALFPVPPPPPPPPPHLLPPPPPPPPAPA